jgi:hypothetical protein
MNKEHNYVDCHRCGNWDTARRLTTLCSACNNTQKVIDPKEVLCNLCAGPMTPLGTPNEQYPHGLYKVSVEGGYNSYHLLDMSRYSFSFCEECLRKLFIQCKIKPDVYDMDFDGDDQQTQWEHDQEIYEYRVWKDSGGHHQAYLDRKCNFVKDCPNTALYTQYISNDFTENCCCEEHKDLWGYSNGKLTKFIPNVLKPFL